MLVRTSSLRKKFCYLRKKTKKIDHADSKLIVLVCGSLAPGGREKARWLIKKWWRPYIWFLISWKHTSISMLQVNTDLHCPSYCQKCNAQVIDKKLVKKCTENLNTGLLALLCEVSYGVHANYFMRLTKEIFWKYFMAWSCKSYLYARLKKYEQSPLHH